MTKEQKIQMITIISTLAETGGCPESSLYLLMGMDAEKYRALKCILVGSGMVQVKGHYCTLTARGEELAASLNDALVAGKQ